MNVLKSMFHAATDALSADEAKGRIDSDSSLFILDVRQPNEFREGHLTGAKLIPLNELAQRVNELPKDRAILCVCRSGARSGVATRQLNNAGYQAINLQGGMSGWQRAGYPVKRGN